MGQGALVTRQSDPLEREVWGFTYIDGHLYLNYYGKERRDTARHKFYPEIKYHRLDARSSNIEEQAVPLPDDVKQEAHNIFSSQIQVRKWAERYGKL